MRLPLAVVTRLAVHNFLAQFKMSVPVPDGSVGAAAAGDVGELLGAVLDAQGRRVAQFLEFRRGFEELLVSHDLATYNAVCARVASAFADISGEVNAAGASLRAAGRSDLFESVAALQAQEKEQLRLEATLQVLRKEHAKRAWSWQRRVDAAALAASELRPAWARNCRVHVAEAEEAEEAAGCSCGVGEPSEEEYGAAVGEATRALQAAVVQINDLLDELREARAEAQ